MPMNPRLLRPRASGFDPRRIANIAGWYTPRIASSYVLETGVKTLNDLSSVGNHLTQDITNNQPTISNINGKPALLFDGSNDQLVGTGSGITSDNTGQFSMFVVLQAAGSEAGYAIAFNSASPSNGSALYVATGPVHILTNSAIATTAAGANISRGNNVPEIFTAVYNNGSATLAVNGAVGGTTVSFNFPSPTNPLVLGNRFGGSAAGTFFSGLLGDVILFNRALSEAERKQVERFLGAAYGITVT